MAESRRLKTDVDIAGKHCARRVVCLSGSGPDGKCFGTRNLLVIGSPASNHLARIINQMSILRVSLLVKP
jgi:hypothetical protein